MKARGWIGLAAVAVIVAGGYMISRGFSDSKDAEYDLTEVTIGDVKTTVSATGTLSPVTTVEVGTQVSGTIDSVYVDFNELVRKGQVLAVLDTALLKASVQDAEATVERNEALLEEAEANLNRNQALFDQKLISEADFLPFKVAVKTQVATLKSAAVALDRARRNIQYAVIRSPITGIVIARNVETGQTVAASLSTPTLFVIAQDLAQMEILAQVDESDIGEIKDGQEVSFEVAAYNDKEFFGVVRQVRLQPATVSNVVTYTVVVEAANSEGLLLPGMTATLELIIDRRDSVLLVPNKALRFQPDADLAQEAMERHRPAPGERQSQGPDSSVATARPGGDHPAGAFAQRGLAKDASIVWYLDESGLLTPARLKTGLTDGTRTEIVASRNLTEGTKVIVGLKSDAADSSTNSRNTQMRFGPPRGF
jgi:HlyD family secretion protein